MNSPDTAGTTVVVGAAQGIGEGIARRLAREPWTERLVLADIRFEGVRALAAELGAEPYEVDITDGAQVDGLAEATSEAERVAIAAGIFAPASALDVERDEFARIFSVNAHGRLLRRPGLRAR